MGMQILALACLIGAIVLGFARKVNVGIVCLGLALILGKIGGISDGDIYAGFPYKLFCTLLGTMLFFSLLQQNGTLEKISEKLIGLCGKNTFLVPVIIYVVSYLLSAAGPGAISVQSVTVLFAVSLAVQMDANRPDGDYCGGAAPGNGYHRSRNADFPGRQPCKLHLRGGYLCGFGRIQDSESPGRK